MAFSETEFSCFPRASLLRFGAKMGRQISEKAENKLQKLRDGASREATGAEGTAAGPDGRLYREILPRKAIYTACLELGVSPREADGFLLALDRIGPQINSLKRRAEA